MAVPVVTRYRGAVRMKRIVVSNAMATRVALPPTIEEYAYVVLTRDVEAADVLFPRGVVVHRHDDQVGCEVEFETPRFAVGTLTACDIEAA